MCYKEVECGDCCSKQAHCDEYDMNEGVGMRLGKDADILHQSVERVGEDRELNGEHSRDDL